MDTTYEKGNSNRGGQSYKGGLVGIAGNNGVDIVPISLSFASILYSFLWFDNYKNYFSVIGIASSQQRYCLELKYCDIQPRNYGRFVIYS